MYQSSMAYQLLRNSRNKEIKGLAMVINQDIEKYLKYEIKDLSEDDEMKEKEGEDVEEEDQGEVDNEDEDEKDKFDVCMKEDDEEYIPAHTEISLFQKYLQHPLFNDD